MISPYLLDIIYLLAAAVIAVPFFKFIKFGAVPGFLIAGVIVGPSGFALINNIEEIGQLAEIGVVFLLFVIGIELKPSRLWLMRRLVFGLGTLQVLITGLLLGCMAYFLFSVPLRSAILIGPVLALSSTAFVLQLLAEQKALTSVYGRTSFSVLLLQDIAVVPLLALVPLLAMPEMSISTDIGLALLESLLILGLVMLMGHYLLRPVFRHVAGSGSSEVFTASAVLLVLGFALITEHIGLSMAMGAFLAGLLISDSPYKHQVMAEIHPFRGLLLGLFFMSMGMLLNLDLLLESPILSFGMVGLLIIVKAVLLGLLAYFFGLKLNNSIAVALLLAQSGEFALVIFSLAYQTHILSDALFQQLLLIVLLSMLSTPALAYAAQRLVKNQGPKNVVNMEDIVAAPIVIAGFGRVGSRIGEILSTAGKPYVALDSNVALVEQERKKGHPIFYGDVCKTKLLEAAGVAHAQVVIVTTNDAKTTEQVVVALRKTHPEIPIYVRGHGLSQCQKLRMMGASGVVSETVEASLELARMALVDVGADQEHELILENYRQSYQAKIDDVMKS